MRKVIGTSCGMYCLWNTSSYVAVVNYDAWDRLFCKNEDIEKAILAGAFVPINMGSDGVVEIEARVGNSGAPAELTDRERKYLLASSPQPYLLVTSGVAHFGGLEHIESIPSQSCGRVELSPGRYSVMVHLIDWAAEPGMLNPDDSPASGALPDVILLINPATDGEEYRRSAYTVER